MRFCQCFTKALYRFRIHQPLCHTLPTLSSASSCHDDGSFFVFLKVLIPIKFQIRTNSNPSIEQAYQLFTYTGISCVGRRPLLSISLLLCYMCGWHIKLLKPTGYVIHHQFNIQQLTLCPHCIYVFCIYLRTNSDLCHLQHKLIGFYKRNEKCLLRGTNWVFN